MHSDFTCLYEMAMCNNINIYYGDSMQLIYAYHCIYVNALHISVYGIAVAYWRTIDIF